LASKRQWLFTVFFEWVSAAGKYTHSVFIRWPANACCYEFRIEIIIESARGNRPEHDSFIL